MTSLPGLNPKPKDPKAPAQQPKAGAGPADEKNQRPEAVQLMLIAWLVAGGLELVHQILQIVMSMMNRQVLVATLRTAIKEREGAANYSDAILNLAANFYIFGSALVFIVIIGVLMFLISKIAQRHKWAGTGRRVWFAFSLYFAFRVFLVFMSSPAGSDVPDAFFVADGILQILIGVTAAMGLAFCGKEEVLDYTGELAQLRELEKEMRKKQAEQDKADKEEKR